MKGQGRQAQNNTRSVEGEGNSTVTGRAGADCDIREGSCSKADHRVAGGAGGVFGCWEDSLGLDLAFT